MIYLSMEINRENSVRGISGFFYTCNPSRESFPFRGNISFSEKTIFEGNLMDKWGSSKIKGILEEKRLNFTKVYSGKNYLLDYSFEKGKSGFFKGIYRYKEYPHSGALSICRIHDKWPGREVCKLESPGEYSGFYDKEGVECDELKNFFTIRPSVFYGNLDLAYAHFFS